MEIHQHNTGRVRAVARVLPLLLAGLAAIAAACLAGSYPAAATDVAAVVGRALGLDLPAPADAAVTAVVLDLRLLRALLAYGVGAALAVAGAVFQGVLRNPLADPFTLGVSGGAAFGAALSLSLSLAVFFGTALATPACALLGGGATLAAVLALSRLAGGLRRETVVLAGIVAATFLSALLSLVKALNEESVAGIVFWIMGGFQGRGRAELALFLPCLGVGLAAIWLFVRELDILLLGETQARQLGVAAGRARLVLLTAASLLTAAAVAVSGVIGFVGLIAPHACRRLYGGEHGTLLLQSALAGGALLVASDVLARTILPGGAELPVGVVTALCGGPFFCALLLTGRSGART
ncbi:FecCD family ABC transporter permease [Desulfovibrio sp. TomC]|uniref:FecCD family ABC transporter permease n=1 Tax=Desulfovibrio sp. TomC TaxID=1562888 RepID=UPI00064D63AD|nr:iron ABC transporter permease [Desulfovibrio sp. TomC]